MRDDSGRESQANRQRRVFLLQTVHTVCLKKAAPNLNSLGDMLDAVFPHEFESMDDI